MLPLATALQELRTIWQKPGSFVTKLQLCREIQPCALFSDTVLLLREAMHMEVH